MRNLLLLITALMFVACKQQPTMSIHDKELIQINGMFPNPLLIEPTNQFLTGENTYMVVIGTMGDEKTRKGYHVIFNLDGTFRDTINMNRLEPDGVTLKP